MRERHWIAQLRWPPKNDKKFQSFLFGAGVVSDSELDAERQLRAAWARICPFEVDWIAIIPGQVIVVYDQEESGAPLAAIRRTE